ncbi:AI-2E family transporter [Roseovarius sp. D22-M7]|uniref:AI-2E family transporter n=1 Tax=Roseovarius sp. D22-M7 TaxID=3127116 RepID=UPI00300FEB07
MLDDLVNRIGETVVQSEVSVCNGGVSGFGNLVQAIVFRVVMPVVVFYLLLGWQRMLAAGEKLVPRANLDTTRRLMREIDPALSGYVRGTATVFLFLAGLISFIPCVGATIALGSPSAFRRHEAPASWPPDSSHACRRR